MENDAFGFGSSSADTLFTVDAVADLPDYLGGAEGEVIIGPSEDGILTASETSYEKGVASQSVGGGLGESGSTVVFTLGESQFHDYTDGSEEHFVLVRCDSLANWNIDTSALGQGEYAAFVSPPGGTLETIWLDAGNRPVAAGTAGAAKYYKIVVDNSYLVQNEGKAHLNLPAIVGEGTENGTYQFDVKVGAEEHPANTRVDQEKDVHNNFAVTDVEAVQVKVQALESKITVSTGWAYESAAAAGSPDNPAANPDGTGASGGHTPSFSYTDAGGTVTGSAAFIKIDPQLTPGETLGQWITLTFDASRGDIYNSSGIKLSSSDAEGRGFVTLPRDYVLGGEPVYFVPNPDSDDDSDLAVTYDFSVEVQGSDGKTKTFTVSNEIPVIIDAVADAAAMELVPDGMAPDFDGFVVDYTADIRPDATETQYLIISNPDGLLQLGDLGPLASHFTQVGLDELKGYEHPTLGIGVHFKDIGANDIILRIEDLNGLDGLDGSTDGTVNLKIPFTVTDRTAAGNQLDVTIKTVVVEGGGNNAANWDPTQDTEYDFANNIAVTEDTATVHLAQGDFTITAPNTVYEGDKAQQHQLGEADAPEYGTPLNVAFTDPYEALRDISFTFSTPDGSPVDGAVAFGLGTNYTLVPAGGSLRFTAEENGGEARYTAVQVLDAGGSVLAEYAINPSSTLQDLNAAGDASGLRFLPSGDADADVRVDFTARVTDVRSGDVITKNDIPSITITRDAVADLPTDAASSIAASDGGHAAVVAGATVTVDVTAAFGDYTDGSEAQYLFVSKQYLDSIEIPSALAGSLQVLDATTANAVCAQVNGSGGMSGASADTHFIIKIDPAYLQSHGGRLDLPLSATLRTDIAKDGSETLDIKVVTVEHDGFLTGTQVGSEGNNAEPDAANNVAVADASTSIAWATLENVFDFTVENPAYENDQADRHLGDATLAGGSAIRITPQDASEVFDTLTVSYENEDGTAASGSLVLSIGGGSLNIPGGATLHFTYDTANLTHCVEVSYTDADGTTHSLSVPGLTLEQLTSQGLRYVPDVSGNDSDLDVKLTFSGTTRETESGETGVYAPVSVQVMVDAVADKPDGTTTAYDYTQYGVDLQGNPYTAIAEGGAVSFQVNTTFHDYADGSETQYLFVNTKYLADGSLQLIDNATGLAFTGGTAVADPSALYTWINGNPGFVPGPDDAYVVLKIDPAYLAAHGGALSLTVRGALKDADTLRPLGPEKTPLDLDVKAVAVEHQGYLTPEAEAAGGDNDEYRAANNVSVTDIGTQFQWDALLNDFSVTPDVAHEGDQPGQHTGDLTPEHGAALTIAPTDAGEVFTRMDLVYDNTHGDMVLSVNDASGTPVSLILAPGANITFTFDPAHPARITGVTCGEQTLDVYAADGSGGLTLEELTSGGLRYVPHTGDNNDADVSVEIHADTLETASGTTGSLTLNTDIVVDAVADMPRDVSSTPHVTNGKNDTVILNEGKGIDSFEINLKASFNEYADNEEEGHYIFVSGQYLAALGGLPDGITQLSDAAASGILSDAGLSGKYFVLEVSDAYLQAHSGAVDITLTAHLDGPSLPDEDQPLHVDIKAGAIEHQGYNTPVDGTDLGNGHGQDADASNNVSLVDMGLDIRYARLDNDFSVNVGPAHEGDAPLQHTGNNAPAGGAVVDFAPADTSEVFDSLTVNYDAAEGSLYLDLPVPGSGNMRLELPDGATLDFTYRNEGAGATLCTAVTVTIDGAPTTYTLATHIPLHELTGDGRLHYIPAADSQSDADVTLHFTGTSRETATGESGGFAHDVVVTVDAVADKPDATGDAANQETGRTALEPGVPFDVTVNADFGGDLADGSEAHYVFISKDYLASLTVPAAAAGMVTLLDAARAATVCAQVDGRGGIPGANPADYFVLEVDAAWLQTTGGKANLSLEGALKDAAALRSLGGTEGANLTLDMKAVSVEHQGFVTSTTDDLGPDHGRDLAADNNVSVDDASASFTYAVVDGDMNAVAAPAYEGDQPAQHTGDLSLAHGAAVTLAPRDESEVFKDLTLNYDESDGNLVLSAPDGTTVILKSGAELLFSYDPAHPTECLTVQIRQPGEAAPSATLSFADADGRGLSLTDLTTGHLSYVPEAGDHHDADVPVDFSGTLLETESGAEGPVSGSLTVVVDAVADLPENAKGEAFVSDGAATRPAAQPGETMSITLRAEFHDYGEDDAADASEAHYLFIAKEHLPVLNGVPGGVDEITDTATLADIFKAIARTDGTGIHAGHGAAAEYYVLRVSPEYLRSNGGTLDMTVTTVAGAKGVYPVEAWAVAIEHDGYRTDVSGIDGGTDRDATAENNVAVADMSFDLVVREFEPEKVTVTLASEWAYENDRSEGDEKYHDPANNEDRDHGVQLIMTEPGEGNVVSSITFEYPMPSNGSATPHRIESFVDGAPNPDVTITYDTTTSPGKVIVTVTANDPYGSVGELHFVPGDNYDNDDVDITVVNVTVADPLLHQTSENMPGWGNGVAPGSEDLHVKVDAVAQAPEVDIAGVDHDSGNPVLAGGVIHITGQVSFEDTADGSEQHFILLEMQDGYYPDEVTLTFNGRTVTIPVQHYVPGTPATPANYTMQQLITADDNQPHLFMKLPVDDALARLTGGGSFERMDDIKMDVAYQTREWAAEGAALHFAAIATEDVEGVREYDVNWNITNDELPFDKQLEKYVPGLTVTANNTAITVQSQGAYVYWDSNDPEDVTFKGYVAENDRPSDHQREPVYILERVSATHPVYVEDTYPVDPALQPVDPVTNTGRDYGTGIELKIPENARQITLSENGLNQGHGDFYFLPESVWTAYMKSPAPLTDSGLAKYKVPMGATVTAASDGYTLVFIPSHEPYNASHQETNASHKDADFRFDYEILANQYSPGGKLLGQKKYVGENEVIRVDAVANQAEHLEAMSADPVKQFSLWGGSDKCTSFDLTVNFHDLDATEDHYILVEMVPNFAFRCGSYYYMPGTPGSISPNDSESIFTHVMEDENGNQSFIRYYKIPVDMADIDPVTGQATVLVEFLRQPGMPSVADYPSSDLLTYGALTEDETGSRWDSYDPTAENFINRKGADGEYSYENNTSVIIRNGMGRGDPNDGDKSPGWWEPGPDVPPYDPDPNPGGGGRPPVYWPGGPGPNWNDPFLPGTPGPDTPIWPHGGPGTPGPWTPGPDGGGKPPVHAEHWIDTGPDSPWPPSTPGPDDPDDPHSPNPWIASRSQGLAIEWVFENSTPLGNLEFGQYNIGLRPTQIYFTNDKPNDAAYVKITVPGVNEKLITNGNPELPWVLDTNSASHYRAILGLRGDTGGLITVEPGSAPNEWIYTIQTPGGHLPEGVELFMIVAPDNMGEDFQLDVAWYNAGGKQLSSGKADVLVDAVAQWANFGFEEGHEDGVYGVTGEEPTQLVNVDIEVAFLDQDGSESNYLLIERLPGVLPLHANGEGGYDPVRDVYLRGKTYFIIEPTEAELRANKMTLQFSVNEELTSPMYVRDDIVHNGQTFTGMHLNVGTMTVEGQIGSAAVGDIPANWEYTLDNNTSLNMQEDGLTILISKVNAKGGNSTIMALETAAPEEHLIWLDPDDPANGLNLTRDGNDILTSLIFTGAAGNGAFWYVDEGGAHHPLPTGVNMADAYLAGRIYHKQDRYQDADATLEWTAALKDGVTDNSEVTVSGKLTVAVDAVAGAEEIHLTFPVLDKAAGTLTQTLTFDDHQNNEQHYAVIAPDLYRVVGKQAQVQGSDGVWHTVNVETIFDPDGNPYYAVLLDGYLDAAGAATVRFEMHELNIPGIENFPVISGGVSIEPNSGYFPEDREPNLANNWAINTKAEFVNRGVVDSKDLAFTAVEIVEDSATGAPITLTGEIGANDTILSAVLTFTPQNGAAAAAEGAESAAFTGAAGDQIATIVYDGRCFAVTLDGAGNAAASVSFGAGGFDPAADFRIVWGVAHMENGALVVDSWNHDADGRLDLHTAFTVQNGLSGQTRTINGADPDGITLTARADAASGVSGQITAINDQPAAPADPAGAGEDSLTVTLNGAFVDLDGSESHYLLLEVPEGWQVLEPMDGTFQTVNGLRYYRVEVDGGQARPSADVTLRAPDGLNSEVNLKTGAQAVESNGDSLFTQGADVALHLSDVSATGIRATASPIAEDGQLSLAALADAVLLNNDGNDTLRSVTFTDLKGGTIVDADGVPVSELTFTAAELASGRYFYRPAAEYAGELDAQGKPLPVVLGYDAQLGETDTGAKATLTGQTLSVTITPVADAPEGLGGVSDTAALDNVRTGHKADVSVTLQAAFNDVDGSEEHFFVVRTPDGVTVQNGAAYTFTLLAAADLAALGLPADFPTEGLLYKVILNDNTQASASLALHLEVTTTVYNGGQLDVVGGAAELRQDGTYSYACSGAHSVALPPAIDHAIGNADPVPGASEAALDSLRALSVSGAVALDAVDPDGDSVTMDGVSFGDTQGMQDTVDGRECHTVQGRYGTLHLFDDGTYRYDLDPAHHGVAAQEVFDYRLADGYGGTGHSTITISLAAPNVAPAATPVAARLDSVRQTEAADRLVFSDSDGDAVTVASVNGNDTRVNFGTADAPLWGFEAAGLYGTLRVYEDADGQWRYTYTLDPAHRGEVEDESFTFVVRDEHGLETTSSIAVDLYNANAAPVAGTGAVTLDTLRDADGQTAGVVALSDADGDAVTLNALTGPKGAGAWGVDDKGDRAFVAQGEYGTLYLYQGGAGALQYRYVLSGDPAGGLDATEAFTYTVDDGYLGTASNTITINLSNTNAAPVIAGDLSNELDTLRSATGRTDGALAFTDPDYNPDQGRHDLVTLSNLAFGDTAGTSDGSGGFTVNGTHGVFHIDAAGAYTYTLNADAAGALGTESFTVTLTDEFGATRSETVAIDLVVHNQNPTASSGSVSLNTWRDGGRTSGLVTLADADGDTVTVDSVSGAGAGVWGTDPDGNPAFVVQGAHGMLYLHENGTYNYVLDAASQGASGTDAFEFTVRDGFGGSASNTITVNLSDANAAPVLSGDLAAAIRGSIQDYESGVVRESGRIAWSDADGDAIDSVTVGGVALPSSGEVSIEGRYGTLLVTTESGSGASWIYTMKSGLDAQGINDVDSFGIVVRDIYGGEASQALDVTLTPLSHAPECEDLNITWPRTPSGLPVSFVTGDLPFSDVDLGYDPEESLHLTVNGVAVTGEVTVEGRYGSLTINPDGGFTYTSTNYSGQDVLEDFTYTVTDVAGNSDEAHLHIRLSENAPDFPNGGTAQTTALFEESLPVMPDEALPAVDHAPADDPQPVEVDLLNVPLPYDPADLGVSA